LQNNKNYQFAYKTSFEQFLNNRAKTSDLVFPDDLNIKPPGEDVSPELAQFSGTWFGLAKGVLNTAIVVEEIYNNYEAETIYVWGLAPQWNVNTAGWDRFRATFTKGTLLLSNKTNELTITLKMLPNGKMEEIYQRPGIYSKVILTKIEK
jgi:hypothetical protein